MSSGCTVGTIRITSWLPASRSNCSSLLLSALASLWQVDDIGTAELMRTFYDGLRAGKSRSDALRAAQAAMIARGGRVADPWVWAAFTMLGGWR